jgi:1-hydroxycarotenoid 3,4-desaturase
MQWRTRQKVVVIGAGMGGLAAAIRLAASGLSVTLIEAHGAPGGKMRSIATEAGPADAGPTVLTLRAVFDDLFALAGERLEDHLTLIPQLTLARHFWTDGTTLDLHADPDASAAAIAAFAGPKAEVEFAQFNRMTTRLYSAFDAPMMRGPAPHLPGILLNTLRTPAIWPAATSPPGWRATSPTQGCANCSAVTAPMSAAFPTCPPPFWR